MKTKKPTKTKIFSLNGKIYEAESCFKVSPRPEPKRIEDEFVEFKLPKHTSLFVKTLEETIDREIGKASLEAILKGNLKVAENLTKNHNQLKLEWMKSLLIKWDVLTSQIVTRLS